MLAARMCGYNQPLVLEEVKGSRMFAGSGAGHAGVAGMCLSDAQLIDGYFEKALGSAFPITPGHEIAGWYPRSRRDCRPRK